MKARDGVRLVHASEGGGTPAFVFIHGGLGNHSHFAPQLEHFGRFAEDVAHLCEQEGLTQVVAVGHSLGGVIALDLAVRFPELARAVVLLEAPVVPPADHAKRGGALLDLLRGPDFPTVVEQWARRMVKASSEHAEQVVSDMVATPRHVALSAVEHLLRYDTDAAVASCRVPILTIDGVVDAERFGRLCPRVVFGKTVGGGHFIQLDVPVQVNDMIEQFMRGLS